MSSYYCEKRGWGCCDVASCRERRKFDTVCKICKQFMTEVKRERERPRPSRRTLKKRKSKPKGVLSETSHHVDPDKFYCASWQIYLLESECKSRRTYQHPDCDGCQKNVVKKQILKRRLRR